MKPIRVGVGAKLLAFFLCLLFSCAAFWTGTLTLAHWDDLWSGGNYVESYSILDVLDDDYLHLREAMKLHYEKEWTGSLTYTQQERYDTLMDGLSPAVTNFRYQVHDLDGTLIADSMGGRGMDGARRVQTREYHYSLGADEVSHDYSYEDPDTGREMLVVQGAEGAVTLNPADYAPGQRTPYGYITDGESWAYDQDRDTRVRSVNLVIEFGVQYPLTADDSFISDEIAYQNLQRWLVPAAAAAAVSLALSLALMVFLCRAAGRGKGWEDVRPAWPDRLPLEVYAVADFFIFLLLFGAGDSAAYYFNQQMSLANTVGLVIFTALIIAAVLLALITLAVRVKTHTLWSNTLVARLWRRLWHRMREGFSQWPLIWRAVVLFFLYLAGTLLTGLTLFLIPIYQGIVLWALCLWVKQWRAIRGATALIVGGETGHQIDVTHMFPDLREHAGQLNDLGAGMARAVEAQMKGERFKAELITNVSHDLKTPLTSIINYVDLLKKEEIENPKAAEYIEVLDRKSQRLKKLTEDLVEASKASTGNLTVSRETLGMVQLVDQALGEYEEKLAQGGLSVVLSMPEDEVYIQADGRHLWRVIDNLLGNCAKYTLPGTRVYCDVTRWDGRVSLTVKNISKNPLNISADQLMERFVQGDESRATEGSGLGLSIAQSLTELQGGAFRIDIDGDLFKAVVSFPEYHPPRAEPV